MGNASETRKLSTRDFQAYSISVDFCTIYLKFTKGIKLTTNKMITAVSSNFATNY